MRINRYTVKLVREGGVNYKLEDKIISPAPTFPPMFEVKFKETIENIYAKFRQR